MVTSNQSKLTEVLEAIEEFRKIDSDAPARAIATFLVVAAEPGKPMLHYQQKLELSSSAMSRNVSYLSRWKRLGVAGMDLVEAHDDLADRRFKLVSLTPKGEALAKAIKST